MAVAVRCVRRGHANAESDVSAAWWLARLAALPLWLLSLAAAYLGSGWPIRVAAGVTGLVVVLLVRATRRSFKYGVRRRSALLIRRDCSFPNIGGLTCIGGESEIETIGRLSYQFFEARIFKVRRLCLLSAERLVALVLPCALIALIWMRPTMLAVPLLLGTALLAFLANPPNRYYRISPGRLEYLQYPLIPLLGRTVHHSASLVGAGILADYTKGIVTIMPGQVQNGAGDSQDESELWEVSLAHVDYPHQFVEYVLLAAMCDKQSPRLSTETL